MIGAIAKVPQAAALMNANKRIAELEAQGSENPAPVSPSPAAAPSGTYWMPKHGWTCFFCGENFKTPGDARLHFGADPMAQPGCQIKGLAERGLLWKIRDLERALVDALATTQGAESDLINAMRDAERRYGDAIIEAEQIGYERGLTEVGNKSQPLPLGNEIGATLKSSEHTSWPEA